MKSRRHCVERSSAPHKTNEQGWKQALKQRPRHREAAEPRRCSHRAGPPRSLGRPNDLRSPGPELMQDLTISAYDLNKTVTMRG